MIPISDLRKGNLIKTEHGILPVHSICFNDVYVQGHDGRTLYARQVEGLGIGEISLSEIDENLIREVLKIWLCTHELQNWYYWKTGKELKIEL